jgi:hypothetical protein
MPQTARHVGFSAALRTPVVVWVRLFPPGATDPRAGAQAEGVSPSPGVPRGCRGMASATWARVLPLCGHDALTSDDRGRRRSRHTRRHSASDNAPSWTQVPEQQTRKEMGRHQTQLTAGGR